MNVPTGRLSRRKVRELALRDALAAFDGAPVERWADPLRSIPTPRRSAWRRDEVPELPTSWDFRSYRRYFRQALIAASRVCVRECQTVGYEEATVRAIARRAASRALRATS